MSAEDVCPNRPGSGHEWYMKTEDGSRFCRDCGFGWVDARPEAGAAVSAETPRSPLEVAATAVARKWLTTYMRGCEIAEVMLDALAAEGYSIVPTAAIDELRHHHGPEWVSEAAKAAGKEPWVCFTCDVQDGHWPCATQECIDDMTRPVSQGIPATKEQP